MLKMRAALNLLLILLLVLEMLGIGIYTYSVGFFLNRYEIR